MKQRLMENSNNLRSNLMEKLETFSASKRRCPEFTTKN